MPQEMSGPIVITIQEVSPLTPCEEKESHPIVITIQEVSPLTPCEEKESR